MAKGLRRSLSRAAAHTAGGGLSAGSGVRGGNVNPGNLRQTVLRLKDSVLALTDEAGVVAYTSKKIFDFPEGLISFQGAVIDLVLTKSSAGVNADFDGDIGLGTAQASNNATLSSTEQNLVPTTPTTQAVAGVATAKAKSTATEAGALFDGTTTPVDVYLNVLVDDADHDVTGTPCNLIANGTITVLWFSLGDV